MNGSLWINFIEDEILRLYHTRHVVTRSPQTSILLTGPLITKADAGPSRLYKEAIRWVFRKRIFGRNVHTILGLPNPTTVTQTMDLGYTDFQTAAKRCTDRVTSRKAG